MKIIENVSYTDQDNVLKYNCYLCYPKFIPGKNYILISKGVKHFINVMIS